MLDPAEILARLDHRLAALTEGPRDAPARQRTLRATIAWSYDLLSQEERRAFSRLSVFAASFSPDAAEAVCGADIDTLGSLVERSLVRRLESSRLVMLETIHEYAAEELGRSEDVDDVVHRHAQYFGEFIRRAGIELSGKDQEAWYRAIDADYANVRDALPPIWPCTIEPSSRIARSRSGTSGAWAATSQMAGAGSMPQRRRLMCCRQCECGRSVELRTSRVCKVISTPQTDIRRSIAGWRRQPATSTRSPAR